MGCHSSRSSRVEPTSKPQESVKLDGDRIQESITLQESVKLDGDRIQESITLQESVKQDGDRIQESITLQESVKRDGDCLAVLTLDGNAINATHESLNKFFGPGYTTYILVSENTRIDPPTDLTVFPADMIVLNSSPNPFVVPTLTLDKLIFQSILPPNVVLHVSQNGQEAAFVYQIFSSVGNRTTSPFSLPTNRSGDTIQCVDPRRGGVNPEDFLWTQEGVEQDFQLFREQDDGTKLYWQFTGVEGIATLSDNLAQALSARLNFRPLSRTLDGIAIKKVDEEILKFFGPGFKSYIIISPNAKLEIDPEEDYFKDKLVDLLVLNHSPNPFVVPTPALDSLTFKSLIPPHFVLHIAYNGTLMGYVYHISPPPPGASRTSPYMDSTSRSGGAIPCKDPLKGGQMTAEFLWTQLGTNAAYKICMLQGGKDLYWEFSGVDGIAKLAESQAQALSARLNVKP